MKMVVLCCALLSLIGVVSARPRIEIKLTQNDANEYETTTERRFDYADAFLAGFRS